ncbi:MAG TPA: tripartite tricarboxylate transporter substrate-binding protein, partial [Xanthobacteraceae bacterium]|nr:tripartite tricarboxylate transporter substrate-binding protein [Xanthobacteraceae bacterium]
FIEAGSVRALAISGDERSPSLPGVPTMREAGFPEYKAVSWFGLLAPAGTPLAVIEKLSAAVAKAVDDPGVTGALRDQGIVPRSSRPAQFAAFIAEQLELHRRLADEAGLKFEQ